MGKNRRTLKYKFQYLMRSRGTYRINISNSFGGSADWWRYDQANAGTKCGAFNLPMSGGQWIQIKGRAVSTPKVDGTDRNLLLRGAVSGLYRSYIIVYQFNSVYTSHIFRTCPILYSSNTWSWYPSWQGPQPLNLTVLYYWFPPLAMTGWTP